MLIIPAVDIRNGKCVRLTYGQIKNETVYFDDPVSVAKRWENDGAKRVHIVDLDGAFEGFPKNISILEQIRSEVKCEIEFGGGIRNMETIDKLFSIGINFVILGTVAVKQPEILERAVEKYGNKVIVGIDSKNEKVAITGWTETSTDNAYDFAKVLKKKGIEQIIFTDISKDGAMLGPNVEAMKKMAKESSMKVIASGGVSKMDDIKKLKEYEKYGINGMIIGKALYTGDIILKDALKI